MTQAAIATEVDQALDAHRDFAAQIAFDRELADFGTQTLENWTNFPKFLYDNGLLVDHNGDVLTAEPDYASYFTNDYSA